MENKGNSVKHPAHYAEGRKYEPKDVIRDWGLNFNLGSAVKYISRAGRKDNIVQDLKKAQEFIQFEIDAIEAGRREEDKSRAPKCGHGVNPVMPTEDPAKPVGNPVKPVGNPAKPTAHSKVGVIEMAVPVGTPREQVIQMFINALYGGE